MELKIYFHRPVFSSPEGIPPEYLKKEVVMVEFPNCISTKTGKAFKWCPTYKQLIDIKEALDKIETRSWGK